MGSAYHKPTGQFKEPVSTPQFKVGNPNARDDAADYIANPVFTPDRATVLGTLAKYHKTSGDQVGGTVSVMTAAEQTVVDNQAAHLAPDKAKLDAEIDGKTTELVALGLEFPAGSGNKLSLSSNAREKIYGLEAMDPADFPHPISMTNEKKYVLDTHADAVLLKAAMIKRVIVGVLRDGTNLKDSVEAVTTSPELNAIRASNNARS